MPKLENEKEGKSTHTLLGSQPCCQAFQRATKLNGIGQIAHREVQAAQPTGKAQAQLLSPVASRRNESVYGTFPSSPPRSTARCICPHSQVPCQNPLPWLLSFGHRNSGVGSLHGPILQIWVWAGYREGLCLWVDLTPDFITLCVHTELARAQGLPRLISRQRLGGQ